MPAEVASRSFGLLVLGQKKFLLHREHAHCRKKHGRHKTERTVGGTACWETPAGSVSRAQRAGLRLERHSSESRAKGVKLLRILESERFTSKGLIFCGFTLLHKMKNTVILRE